jgi:hypothetical protein
MSDAGREIFAGASWIASAGTDGALPVFRKTFHVDQVPQRATMAICGLGQFELRVNAEKVGDDVMEPAWSNYRRSCLYVVHEIAKHLRSGENEIRVMLGNGMYNVVGTAGRYKKFKGSFGQPKLIAAADIGDGRVVTNRSWQTTPGPITFSCIYGGEDYDARLEDHHDWKPVIETDAPGGGLVEQDCPPIRVMRAFEPMKVTEPKAGVRVYDLGQNFSGWPSIRMRAGSVGATVKLITGELLDDAGLVSQKNSGSPVWFSYRSRGGDAEEMWHPRFSYTGFRYVQVEGDVAAIANVQGHFIHAALPVVGQFSCSIESLNRIHDLIVAAIRSNMQSVLTDCPHREKLGWLEQAHLMAPSIMANFDASRYFRKLCRDMREAGHENGCVPTIAPQYTSFKPPWDVFNDSPEWGSAIVLVPWHCYMRYGDLKIVEDNYDAMRRYVAYLRTRVNKQGLIDYGLGDWYDIGPGDPGFSKLTPKSLTATAMYFLDLAAMWLFARRLGREEDAAAFEAAGRRTRDAVRAAAFPRSSQTACAMLRLLGLVGEDVEELIADIRAHDNHITAGDIGFPFVIRALSHAGRSDVIFDLLTRTDPPSYGAMLARGATSLTEAWDANPNVSQNHLMLGHAEAWFHEYLGGIHIDMTLPAEMRISIAPTPVGDVTWARVRHDSVLGPIGCDWERSGERFKVAVTVPSASYLNLPDGQTPKIPAGSHTFECSMQQGS